MRKTWFKFFMGLFVLIFAGLWIAGGVAEAGSKDKRRMGHHRRNSSVASYNVGGIVSELADGETVVLLNNGRDDLEITANGAFTFSTPISDLTTYNVTVVTQPSNQYCRVKNGSGTINGEDITDITIRCSIFSVAIAAGNNHAVLLKNDGTVWTWGDNNLMPFQVSGLTDVIAIAAGDGHTVTLKSDGTVWTWGDNQHGQLGNGTRTRSYTPVQVCDTGETAPCTNFLTDIIGITAGGNSIASENGHTIALKSDGTVWAWGFNEYGQLGDGTTIRSTTPVQVIGLTDVNAIAGGYWYTIALKDDGTVWAWGENRLGQLGATTPETCNSSYSTLDFSCSTTPVQVSGLTDITAIAAGHWHTIALKDDGTVWAWGSNRLGQLGATTSETCYSGYFGSGFSCSTTPVQVFGLTDVDAIAAGSAHTLALKSDGTVWAWGSNRLGQLGDGTTINSATPVQVSELTDVIAIAARGYLLRSFFGSLLPQGYSIALKGDGTVWAWGNNSYGQLGDGTMTNSTTPVQVLGETAPYTVYNYSLGGTVSGLADGETVVLQNNGVDDLAITLNGAFTFSTPVSDLAAYNVAVLTHPDNQFCRVNNGSGTINGTNILDVSVTCFDLFTDVTAIATGDNHTIALKNDGTVWAWGSNWKGGLGDGTTTDSSTPVQVFGLTDVAAIASGGSYSIALKTDGTVWAWGANVYGVSTTEKCANGSSCSTTPVEVSELKDVTAIAGGASHIIALKPDGTIWARGNNDFGQLGDGTTTYSTTLVQVSGLTDVIAITANGYHSVALKNDGTLWTWGSNRFGQLGATTFETCSSISFGSGFSCSTTPVQVSDLTDVTAIAAGYAKTVAVKNDGTVWESRSNYSTLVQVSGLTDVAAIAAGYGHTVALKTDGMLWAWGNNDWGRLGDETNTDSTTPVQVSGLTDVTVIASGRYYTVALKIDGTVWAWGNNTYGVLGDGTWTHRSTPVPVLVTP